MAAMSIVNSASAPSMGVDMERGFHPFACPANHEMRSAVIGWNYLPCCAQLVNHAKQPRPCFGPSSSRLDVVIIVCVFESGAFVSADDHVFSDAMIPRQLNQQLPPKKPKKTRSKRERHQTREKRTTVLQMQFRADQLYMGAPRRPHVGRGILLLPKTRASTFSAESGLRFRVRTNSMS